MRICYINRPGLGAVTGTGNAGGGQLQNLREAAELARDKKFDVHMLVEGDADNFRKDGITVTAIPKKNFFEEILQTYSALKRINADIYICRMPTRFQIFYEALLCRMLNKKYVFAEIINPDYIMTRPLTFIGRQLYKTGLLLSASIVANGQTIKEKLSRFTRRKVHAINLTTHLDGKKGLKRKHILWVGRADQLKRPDLFVELAKRFPEERFLMIMAGRFEKPDVKNLKVLNDVPYEKMNDYYASAKILVLTSETEGFPNVFLEAWKNKTPVVSLFVNPDKVLTEHKTGIYSETFEQMVKDVKLLLDNQKKWKECSENGYKYVTKKHNIKKVMEQYKKFFLDENRGSL